MKYRCTVQKEKIIFFPQRCINTTIPTLGLLASKPNPRLNCRIGIVFKGKFLAFFFIFRNSRANSSGLKFLCVVRTTKEISLYENDKRKRSRYYVASVCNKEIAVKIEHSQSNIRINASVPD